MCRPPGVELAVRIGIATGPVIVGDQIGEGTASETAVVGETPNLAARLQALAQPNQIVVSAATRAMLGDHFDLDAGANFGLPTAPIALLGNRPDELAFADRAHFLGTAGAIARTALDEHGRDDVVPRVDVGQEIRTIISGITRAAAICSTTGYGGI
jgi:class 3 adenylate cyclase